MLYFMFGVLGSIVFWVVYIFATLFIIALLMKKFAPQSYRWITEGYVPLYCDEIEFILMFMTYLLFWPFILIGIFIGLFCKYIIGLGIRNIFKKVDSMIPEIQFNKKEE